MPKGPPKGTVNNPKGRGKGVPNRATGNAREAIAKFVDHNSHRLVGWLDRVAVDNPLAAFNCYMSVVEYHIPKLQRQEITGKDGERLQLNVVTGVNLTSQPVVDVDYHVVPALSAPDEPIVEIVSEASSETLVENTIENDAS